MDLIPEIETELALIALGSDDYSRLIDLLASAIMQCKHVQEERLVYERIDRMNLPRVVENALTDKIFETRMEWGYGGDSRL